MKAHKHIEEDRSLLKGVKHMEEDHSLMKGHKHTGEDHSLVKGHKRMEGAFQPRRTINTGATNKCRVTIHS